MKGVILAGGKATRLYPLTHVTNKHLLPVYNKPAIYYAIEKLVAAGIDRIMIVTSPHHVNDFVRLLGSGQHFTSEKTGKQIQIVYGIQNEASGIADGLYIAKDYVGADSCLLYLGDNIFEDDIEKHVREFKDGAMIFLKKVKDPKRFGIATIDKKTGLVSEIQEKPKRPRSDMAVVGLYVYDNTVFQKLVGQPKSDRGEYEITYVNNKYAKDKKLKAVVLKKDWFDIGTFDSLVAATNFQKNKHAKHQR
jgi:glucose-1-phosphate thymidylyltransferase